ncbi:MAG: NrdH-redoxin [Gammaproteobacteria bacterium]|nr:NrdH-redoxin [Gammaproteobacteria bacterium]
MRSTTTSFFTRPLRLFGFVILLLAGSAVAAEPTCRDIEVFVRDGCPHCADAKVFLGGLAQRYPDLSVRYHEVGTDLVARERLLALSRQHGVARPGVPSFLVCGAFQAGFSELAGSDEWIENRLADPAGEADPERVTTPFGSLAVDDLGLPLFTIALGLVDGFNPCAMWVLLFLLSILVNVRRRGRMILIAGTFVLVSGAVYFAFMAAWLNLFLLIGFARWLQLAIALLALAIGAIHIKDFFLLGKGISLSIGDSVKPTLYARVRSVLHAETLWAALAGVIVVAVMVNVVELLCTAGLPALYTQILSQQPMPGAHYYGYLLLYNIAYIADDTLMVTLAVVAMQRFKLQQRQGRWLKLISGLVVFALGLALLLAPDMLF